MAVSKTNAMRILDRAGIAYQVYTYQAEDGLIDGRSVAARIGRPAQMVYKTLVTRGSARDPYVFVLPVEQELDLKKAARAVGEKSVEMVHVADINRLTGYIRGGCSPVGMKKLFRTVIDQSAGQLPSIVVSGGKIGVQVELPVEKLREICQAEFAQITA